MGRRWLKPGPVFLARPSWRRNDWLDTGLRHVIPGVVVLARVTPGRTASVTATCQATAIAEPSFVIEFHDSEPSATAAGTSPFAALTEAEREVAAIVARGVSNDEAAERLGKTVHAVKFLLHRVYRKLNVPNRARLALLLGPHGDS